MKRRLLSSTAAVRQRASDLSGIVTTLVIGNEVEQLESSGEWVRVRTQTGREGWLRDAELGPPVGDAEALIDTQPDVLEAELASVERVRVDTLDARLDQLAQTREAAANAQPRGWEFGGQQGPAPRTGKNYTGYAVLALVLYYFFWVPGLIANIVFLNQANRDKDQLGSEPRGKGCLVWLLCVFAIIPAAYFVGLVIISIILSTEYLRP